MHGAVYSVRSARFLSPLDPWGFETLRLLLHHSEGVRGRSPDPLPQEGYYEGVAWSADETKARSRQNAATSPPHARQHRATRAPPQVTTLTGAHAPHPPVEQILYVAEAPAEKRTPLWGGRAPACAPAPKPPRSRDPRCGAPLSTPKPHAAPPVAGRPRGRRARRRPRAAGGAKGRCRKTGGCALGAKRCAPPAREAAPRRPGRPAPDLRGGPPFPPGHAAGALHREEAVRPVRPGHGGLVRHPRPRPPGRHHARPARVDPVRSGCRVRRVGERRAALRDEPPPGLGPLLQQARASARCEL